MEWQRWRGHGRGADGLAMLAPSAAQETLQKVMGFAKRWFRPSASVRHDRWPGSG